MKRLMMIAATTAAVAGVCPWVMGQGGDVEIFPGTTLQMDSMKFFPDKTLTFSGGDAVLTNFPGFYEFTGSSPGNWAGCLTQPLTFLGIKAMPDRVSELVSASSGNWGRREIGVGEIGVVSKLLTFQWLREPSGVF